MSDNESNKATEGKGKLLIIFAVVFLLVFCISSVGVTLFITTRESTDTSSEGEGKEKKEEVSEEKNNEDESNDDESKEEEKENDLEEDSNDKINKISKSESINGLKLTVSSYQDNVQPENEFVTPGEGMKYVSVEVNLVNEKAESSITPILTDFILEDSKKNRYEATFLLESIKTPYFEQKTLEKGKSIKGWITFEVDIDTEKYTLYYKPDLFADEQISIKLYE